jgi:hypothetical protein
MDHPYYKVTITSLTRGWSYTCTEGVIADPDANVQIIDPLVYSWSFAGELVPGQLDPFTGSFALAAKSATLLPEVQVGDLITLDVRVGTAGPRIIAPPPMRAAEPVVTLGKGKYPARMVVPLSDLSVDWRSRTLGSPLGQPNTYQGGDRRDPRPYWRERGAEIAALASGGGLSLGCPTWWGDAETPVSTAVDGAGTYIFALAYDTWGDKIYDGNLPDVLESFINSHQPGGYTHTWATIYNAAGHAANYRRIGPDTWKNAGVPAPSVAIPAGGALADPAGPVRVEAVPATRKLPQGPGAAVGLPLQFAVDSGILIVSPRQVPAVTAYATQVGLSAEWCVIPATARRARDSVANLINLAGYGKVPTGQVDGANNPTYQNGEYERSYWDAVDAAARGFLARDVPTQLNLGTSDAAVSWAVNAVAAVVANFQSDSTALAASWSYDAFTMLSSLVPQAIAAWLLPVMAPRLPDELDGDGRLVRQLLLYALDDELRFSGEPVNGFVTAGSLTIAQGEMTWTLRTAPGRPQYQAGSGTPVTVGEVQAAGYGTTTVPNVDPLITVADLDYVDY